MADGIEVPVQVKILVQEIVKIEFEIQNNVQSIRQCEGPLSLLNDLNLKVKQKLHSLRQKVEVSTSKNYVQLVALFPDTFCKTVISYLKTGLTS